MTGQTQTMRLVPDMHDPTGLRWETMPAGDRRRISPYAAGLIAEVVMLAIVVIGWNAWERIRPHQ